MKVQTFRGLKLILGLQLLTLSAFAENSGDLTSVPTAGVTPAEWQRATETEYPMTLQVGFPYSSFEIAENPLAQLFHVIPELYPNFKLNTLGRALHSTLLYLDQSTLENAREITEFLGGLTPEILAQYDLINPVKLFAPDFSNPPHISIVGNRSRFLALTPHPDFVRWQLRFYQMVKDLNPALLAKHQAHNGLGERAIQASSVHLSLIQFGGTTGLNLNEAEVEQTRTHMESLIAQICEQYRAAHAGQNPVLMFDMRQNPLSLVTAPVSIQSPPTPIVAFKPGTAGNLDVSRVGRVYVDEPSTGHKRIVEFDIERFLQRDPQPFRQTDWNRDWFGTMRSYPTMDHQAFTGQLPLNLQAPYERALTTLSPTKLPAELTGPNGSHYYVTSHTHPRLAPLRAFPILDRLRQLLPQQQSNLSIGLALYASTGREEIRNPGDTDTLINSLITVPDHIATLGAAKEFAARQFVTEVLGHFIGRAQQGQIAFSELRVGSVETMGNRLANVNIIDALESNPYLSEAHLLAGTYTDENNRTWTLEQLVALGDFLKGKIDYFENGRRHELSIQFLSGFQWRGETHFMHRNGLKGVPPLMRTAVYDSVASFAVAASLARPYDYVNILRGPMLARVVRDIVRATYGDSPVNGFAMSEAHLTSKALKKIYNLFILLRNSGLGLDEIFFEETRRVLRREGTWQEGYSLSDLVTRLLVSINQDQLKLIHTLKRNVNDFSEFNERHQTMRADQWQTRRVEVANMIQELDHAFEQNEMVGSLDFIERYQQFKNLFRVAEALPVQDALRLMKDPTHYDTIHNFEKSLSDMDQKLMTQGTLEGSINRVDQAFLQTFTSYLPHMLYRYVSARSQDQRGIMRWALEMLRIQTTERNFEIFDEIARNMDTLSRSELALRQHLLLSNEPVVGVPAERSLIERVGSVRSKCNDLLTKP